MDETTHKDETDAAAASHSQADEAPNSPDIDASAIPPEEVERLSQDIVAALKTVYDPEIPADIYELGLIYKVDIDDSRHVNIDMTLTAPGCPVAGEMPIWVENAVASVQGVSGATATMVFDPPWTPERMSDEAKVAIGWW
ncbi:FeS assembly SUF system protein [Rhodopseudomonas julia]|uniref:FeS assembly SUF system protein n=1 Tax=Rhodopseudomonas julia TaxID=200617 RepID=A0ABU0CA07_9BRAD|nr:SUF system Fe-S cluster assembly protein [Rhodopseudomonas julia]MDQ0327359.1 FeS assembly SUF system protein [Rhodopseudomonas julia]